MITVLRRHLSDGQHVDAGAPHGLEETAGYSRGMAHPVADRGHDAARAESIELDRIGLI